MRAPIRTLRLGRRQFALLRLAPPIRPEPWTAINTSGGALRVPADERQALLSYDGPGRHWTLRFVFRRAAS